MRAQFGAIASATTTVCLLLFSTACDPLGIDKASERIDKAIDEISKQSSQWQATLLKLEQDLIRGGGSLIAVEVTQLMQRGVATAGAELKCDADFIGHRMSEGLQRIKDRLRKKPTLPLRQYFCAVVPTVINLGLRPEQRLELNFYGYNLDAGRAKVFVRDANGDHIVDSSPRILATPTHYLMTLNLSQGNGLALDSDDNQIVFVLNAGLPSEDTHAVNIAAPTPQPKFSIDAGPPVPVAGGGGSGPGPYTRLCPPTTVGVGLRGRSGDFLDQIQLVCAPLNVDGSLGALVSTPADGGSGGDPFEQNCPAGQVIVGFSGRSSGNVERIGPQCNSPANVVGQTGIVTVIPFTGGGGSPFSSACPAQSAVTGLIIHSNNLVIRMDFACSRLQFK